MSGLCTAKVCERSCQSCLLTFDATPGRWTIGGVVLARYTWYTQSATGTSSCPLELSERSSFGIGWKRVASQWQIVRRGVDWNTLRIPGCPWLLVLFFGQHHPLRNEPYLFIVVPLRWIGPCITDSL